MSKKIIRVGLLTPIRTLDPLEAQDSQSALASSQIYETPCNALTVEGQAQPVLFQSLSPADDRVWNADLRPGLTLSDGSPLTAAVFATALLRSEFIREQATVKATGDRLTFTLLAPNPRFDLALTLHRCAIFVERPEIPLGTGPFVPAPGTKLHALRLIRNEHYRDRVAIDEIAFSVYPPDPDGKATALLEAIRRNEVDFTHALSRSDSRAVTGMRIQLPTSRSTAILFFNTEREVFRDASVRRAVACAVDRLAVAQLAYSNPLAYVAKGILPPILSGNRPEATRDLYHAGAPAAQIPALQGKLLKLVTVWAPRPYLPEPKAAGELIAKQLAALGPEIRVVVPGSTDEFYETCTRGDYDLFLGGWIADTPDPADFLDALLHSERISTEKSAGMPHANRARLRNPDLDAALRRLREDRGPAQYAALHDIIVEHAPFVPLMYGADVVVMSWKLKGVQMTAIGHPLFGNAHLED